MFEKDKEKNQNSNTTVTTTSVQSPVPKVITVSGESLGDVKTVKVYPNGRVTVIKGGIY